MHDAVKLERVLQQHSLLTVTAAARDRESTFTSAFVAVSELEALRGTRSIMFTKVYNLNMKRQLQLSALQEVL
jgi:hypothetical protein